MATGQAFDPDSPAAWSMVVNDYVQEYTEEILAMRSKPFHVTSSLLQKLSYPVRAVLFLQKQTSRQCWKLDQQPLAKP